MDIKPNDVIFDSMLDDKYVLTIAIPTYCRFDLLKETLDSVFSQEFTLPVEVIVVDNNPNTKSLASEFTLKYRQKHYRYFVNDSNLGMFGNWNQCLALSKGKYVMILNDDDLLKHDFFKFLSRFLSCELEKKKIISFYDEVLDQRDSELKRFVPYWLRFARNAKQLCNQIFRKSTYSLNTIDLFFKNHIHGTLGVVFDRERAIKLGGFDEKLYPVADWDFWLRWTATYGPITRVSEKIAYYRVKQNESFNPETLAKFPPSVSKMRSYAVSVGSVPHKFSLFIPQLEKYEAMLGQIGFGDPDKYKFGFIRSIVFYMSMLSQSILVRALNLFYKGN